MHKVIILGAGAIGSTIAATLSTDPDIDLLAVARPDHVKAIEKNGLWLNGKRFNFPVTAKIDFPLQQVLVIITIKSTDLETGLQLLKPFLSQNTYILLLQNGLGIKDLAKEILHSTPVLPKNIMTGIIKFGATFLHPGEIDFFTGTISIEALLDKTPFKDIFNHSFISCRLSPDIQMDTWKKLIVNSIVNPLSVFLKQKNKIVSAPEFDQIKTLILEECLKVAEAEGYKFNLKIENINRSITSDNMTSMLQDTIKKKKTEIDFINGAIVNLAEKHHINVPVNRFIVLMIKAIETLYQLP